ncbi:mannosyltransferase, partial [Candidatus Hakubella thermalkaliphila]
FKIFSQLSVSPQDIEQLHIAFQIRSRKADFMEKKTVLMISPTFLPVIGGSEIYSYDLCEYLSGRGHRVYLIACTTPLKGKYRLVERRENLCIRRIPCLNRKLLEKTAGHPIIYPFLVVPPLLFYSLFFLLRHRNEVDVIHAQSVSAGLVVALLAAIFKKRSLVTTHGKYLSDNPYHLQYNKYAKFIRWVLGRFDRILAINEQSRDELVQIGIGADRIVIAPHWVDQQTFRPADKEASKAEVGWQGKFVVLFAGRFVEDKGINQIIAAAKAINRDVIFAFAGTGPLDEMIANAAKDEPDILYLGRVDNEQMPIYYNAADLILVPSRHAGDGIPRVIIEAFSCGTPVIGANRGGIPGVVTSSVGLIIEPTTEEINRAIEVLFDDRSKLENLTANCRRYAESRFSIRNAEIVEVSYYG